MAETQIPLSSKRTVKKVEEDLPPPPPVDSFQNPAPCLGNQDVGVIPLPPPKESFSKFHEQRQINELKRLYRHMHPEVQKNLEDAVTHDLAEILNNEDQSQQASVISDKALPVEVQSMRWIFENWALDSIGEHQGIKKLTDEETILSGNVKNASLRFQNLPFNEDRLSTSAIVEDQTKGDVRTARWLFETQPLDSLNKFHPDETDVQEAILREPVQSGDVRGTKLLFETHSLDEVGRCNSVEEHSILQLQSEIEESKGDVKKTVKLFQTEPLCAIRDNTGNVHGIKSICREEIQNNTVKSARWLFETQPLDTIKKDISRVQIIRGISLEEVKKGGVNATKWIFETQPLDTIKEHIEEGGFQASTDIVQGADVSKHRLLFETQSLDSLKGDTSDSTSSKEEVVGSDVKSTLWLFETKPMETLKDDFEVGHLKKVELLEEEKGDVKQQRKVFETCSLDSISKRSSEDQTTINNRQEVMKGDVKSYKNLFESLPLDSVNYVDNSTIKEEEILAGHVKTNQFLFETTPLYAIKDNMGNFHEVTSVSREQVISGDVKNYKWMFETQPLDQFDDSIKKVDIIKGITKQELMAGNVRTAKWLFETQPIDVIHQKMNENEYHSPVKEDISKGDVKKCRWLFETQPIDILYDKDERKQDGEPIPQADVKSYTWMFETQPLDSLNEIGEQYLKISTSYQDDFKAVDVKTTKHLFETEPLVNVASGIESKQIIRYSSTVDIQSGEVSRVKEIFEMNPIDQINKTTSDLDTTTAEISADENIQPGSVHKFTWLFENCPMDSMASNWEGIQEILPEKDVRGGDVGGKKFIFETYSLDQINDEVDETEIKKIQDRVNKGDVKSCTMLFETLPLYAIQDKEGEYHEVTSVKKEEIMKGDVRGAKWLFETKPLDRIKKDDEVFVIRAVTQEDIKKGNDSAARWRFETEPLDSISRENRRPVMRTVDDVQKGDVQASKQLFESQQLGQKKYIRMVSVSDVQEGNVRTSTWLFENQPMDSLKGDFEENSSMTTVQREDNHKGDVKRCTWLFESQPLDSLKDTEASLTPDSQEVVPQVNVKSTTWLFESTPLDKFGSKYKRDISIREKNVRETLESLYICRAIQYSGIVIEANEAEKVKMAKYQFTSQGAPDIQKEEIVEGNLQRILLQLLQRTDMEPQGILAKENDDGKILVSTLQLLNPCEAGIKKEGDVSDDVSKALQCFLNQDASVKKGIIMQETERGSVKITIYYLSNHCEYAMAQEEIKGDVKSTIGSLLASTQNQKSIASVKREDNEKGEVQLYASCIEKGDLDYFKNRQRDSEINLLNSSQNEQTETSYGEVKETSKTLFQDKDQTEKTTADGNNRVAKRMLMSEKCTLGKNVIQGDTTSSSTAQSVAQSEIAAKRVMMSSDVKTTKHSLKGAKFDSKAVEKEQLTSGQKKETKSEQEESTFHKVLNQKDAITKKNLCSAGEASYGGQQSEDTTRSDLQTAMQSLRQATAEAKSIQSQVQGKLHKSTEKISLTTQDVAGSRGRVQPSLQDHASGVTKPAGLQKSGASTKKVSASEKEQGQQLLNACQESKGVPSADISIKDGIYTAKPVKTFLNPFIDSDYQAQSVQEEREQDVVVRGDVRAAIRALQSASSEQKGIEKEDVVRGNLKATLQSLEKSNINISKGDFKAAMIYKNAGKSYSVFKRSHEDQEIRNQNAIATMLESDHAFPPPPSAAVMRTEHCLPPTAAREAFLPQASNTDRSEELSAKRHGDVPKNFLPVYPKASGEMLLGNLHNLPEPQAAVTERKKPIPPPKPQHLSAPSNHNTGKMVKSVPPPLPPKPPGLNDIPKPKIPTNQEKAANCPETSEQWKHEGLPNNLLPEAAKSGNQNSKRKEKKTPLQIAEEKYKESKVEQDRRVQAQGSECQILNAHLKAIKSISEESKVAPDKLFAGERIRESLQSHSENNISKPETLYDYHTSHCDFEGQNMLPCSQKCSQAVVTQNVTTSPKNSIVKLSDASKSEVSQSTVQKTRQGRQEGLVEGAETPFKQSTINVSQVQQDTSQKNVMQCSKEMKPERTPQTQEPGPIEQVVVRREKQSRETEDERRKRLSIHKDEIMKGNVKAAMDIFENLRRHEELQQILTQVKELEEETSGVNVKSLKGLFEKVPEWVVDHKETSYQLKPSEQPRAKSLELTKEDSESISSVELAFEDLERASAEITHLKKQTLERLLDIEEAIKKALYSVSSLKSESDIAGLSGLFKESLGSTTNSTPSANIQKISIVSNKTQPERGFPVNDGRITESSKLTETFKMNRSELEAPSVQHRVSSPVSPSYISIESAARKSGEPSKIAPHLFFQSANSDIAVNGEQFTIDIPTSFLHNSQESSLNELIPGDNVHESTQIHKGLNSARYTLDNSERFQQCCGHCDNWLSDSPKGSPVSAAKGDSVDLPPRASMSDSSSPRRQKSVLELKTGPDGAKRIGTTTVTEEYEESDQYGNKIVTSKTSTTVTKQSESKTSSTYEVISTSPRYEVTASPLIRRHLHNPLGDSECHSSANETGVVFVTFGSSKLGKK
ncbi:xin actin-binding repeat-containing protein 1 [Rhinatrema bivittatum]|uniref:xin actin-binding repeat-containing protein 1 n=1 Tax=Rhinatrema bivittatum TaxID=194408 RepID=UPI00112C0609|nr:xin actin-binding repeat-containing protein 1 [Rhinatrema bivittatum]